MAKLSELLTGEPSTWRKVYSSKCMKVIQFKFQLPGNDRFIGHVDGRFIQDIPNDLYDDWQYYEEPCGKTVAEDIAETMEPKSGYEKGNIPFPACYLKEDNSIAHVYLDDNSRCQCGSHQRLSSNVSIGFINTEEPKPKVTRWLWAKKDDSPSGWRLSSHFHSDDEAAIISDQEVWVKLPWTETEFSE